MSKADLIRAWKDPSFRSTLSDGKAADLTGHPSGLVDLTDDELRNAAGLGGIIVTTFKTCTEFTFRRFHCCK